MNGRALIARALARLGLRRALVVVRKTTPPEAEPPSPTLACTWLAPSAAAGLESLRPGLGSEARERFGAIPGVHSTQSTIALETIKESWALPVESRTRPEKIRG